MPQPPLYAHRLTKFHRTWWVIACLVLSGIWLVALVLQTLFIVVQYEDLVQRNSRRIFDNLMERQHPAISAEGKLIEVREDRDHLLSDWLPHRLQEAGLGKEARIQSISRKAAETWLSATSRERPGFLSATRNLGRHEIEFLLPIPQAPKGLWMKPPHFDHKRPPVPPMAPPPFHQWEPRHLPPDVEFFLIRLPLLPVLWPTFVGYGVALLLGAALLGSFGFSLKVLQRGIAQELAIAHAKANFTAMVSHELKTPVAVLRMYAEMLRDGLVSDPKKQEEFHQTMVVEAVRLQRLIQNLLDLGKVQAGSRSYKLSAESPSDLISEASSLALSLFPARKGEVLFAERAWPWVLADHEIAVQAISNLIHNALKYGEGQPVEIAPRQDGDFLAIDVLDRGKGIPLNDRKRIFEPYARLEAEDTRTSQGTGLGLALVKAYMEGHGGSVEVKDRAGGGSVFTLRFRTAGKGDWS